MHCIYMLRRLRYICKTVFAFSSEIIRLHFIKQCTNRAIIKLRGTLTAVHSCFIELMPWHSLSKMGMYSFLSITYKPKRLHRHTSTKNFSCVKTEQERAFLPIAGFVKYFLLGINHATSQPSPLHLYSLIYLIIH